MISGSWYSIASYKQNQFLVLKANPKYWGTPAKVPTLTFTWVATDDVRSCRACRTASSR